LSRASVPPGASIGKCEAFKLKDGKRWDFDSAPAVDFIRKFPFSLSAWLRTIGEKKNWNKESLIAIVARSFLNICSKEKLKGKFPTALNVKVAKSI
jgi:hypothetical protein